MTTEINSALAALEHLSSSSATSSSGALNALLETHFAACKQRILAGDNPKAAITELQKNVIKAKKETEKGLKAWYSALGNVGKEIDSAFPPTLGAISAAYDNPALFSTPEASAALNQAVVSSLGDRGMWDAVDAFEQESGIQYDPSRKPGVKHLLNITNAIAAGNINPAIDWCVSFADLLNRGPTPSPLPFYLHQHVFASLPPKEAILYARKHLLPYVPSQKVLQLLTSTLYRDGEGLTPAQSDIMGQSVYSYQYKSDPAMLVALFREEYCKVHRWAKEDPLEVVVDLGSRGGALHAIEKARRVMGEHLGDVRSWQELPMEIPLPASRRYHSVFVCPVSKEQATKLNPPKMLICGHTVAQDSFNLMFKAGRSTAKCPYCPVETSVSAVQTLHF